jgi:hypothetical protein
MPGRTLWARSLQPLKRCNPVPDTAETRPEKVLGRRGLGHPRLINLPRFQNGCPSGATSLNSGLWI